MTLEQYILGAYLLGVFFTLGYSLSTFISLEAIDGKPRALWPAFVMAFLSWGFFIGMYILFVLTGPNKKS